MSNGFQHRGRRHGRSIEEEVREILRNAVKGRGAQRKPLGRRLRERVAGRGRTARIARCNRTAGRSSGMIGRSRVISPRWAERRVSASAKRAM
ncbi:MAG: FitA-like ribbon-helix-helix domain-containing protein [Geminicoccaceae bacterium]